MKKIPLIMLLVFFVTTANSQSWVQNTSSKWLYTSPDTTKVGIGTTTPTERLQVTNGALKVGNTSSGVDRARNMIKIGDGSFIQIGEWEADDMLSFKANAYSFTNGNVGIGSSAPQYKLDVNGKMYLRTDSTSNSGWALSHLYWQKHSLVLGTPPGVYSHNSIDIMPGGCDTENDVLFSRLCMYSAHSTTDIRQRIELRSEGNCWIDNGGAFGIGTSNPQYKLDVRGTIRAQEIIVNTPGADFVFENDYHLRPLQDVKSYIQQNHHLPEIPSAHQMQEDGMSVNEMVIKLLQKVEELTLYNIQLEERISELENSKK